MALGSTQPAIEMNIVGLKRDGPCAETRFYLSEKRTGPFESAGVSAYSGCSRRSVHIVVTLGKL
jgi:hypothetical protein